MSLAPQTYRKVRNLHRAGLAADRPLATTVLKGTLYYSTDTFITERSNGAIWETYTDISGGSGGPIADHAATHEPGGSDPLTDAAWTDQSNLFTENQTVDGDLVVTGVTTPVTQQQRDKINQLIGAPGPKMLMSKDYSSGLSLRHDGPEGRVTCGNYDTQTYQPLIIEAREIQFKTGDSPILNENVRIHSSGGVSIGLNHTDPGTGIIRADGLDGTPLNSSNLVGMIPIELLPPAPTFEIPVPLRIPSGDSQVALIMGTAPNSPALRGRDGNTVDVVSGDNQVFLPLTAAYFYAWGGNNSFGDLTVRGGADFQNGLVVSNSANPGQANSINGYTYIVNPNTALDASLFLNNRFATGGAKQYRLMSYDGFFRIWNGDNNAQLLTVDSTGVMRTSDTIHCGGALQTRNGYVFPADINSGATEQGSWFLAGHNEFGLYCNTGLYLESYLWSTAVESRNHIRAAAGLFDYGRGVPIGEWTNFTPSIGNGTLISVYACKFMLVGKTLFIKLNIIVSSSLTNFSMYLPAGLTNRAEYCNDAVIFADAQTTGLGMAQASPNDVLMYFYKNIYGNAAWVGQVTIVGTLCIPIY